MEKETGQVPVLPPAYSEKPGISKSLSALKEDAEHLAESEWRRLALGDEPIKDVFSLIESQGVHVIRQEMGNAGFDGAFLYSPDNGAFLILNASRPVVRQAFTAAHEYCHCLKHRNRGIQIDRNVYEDYLNTDAPTMERYANAFAAAFLMPRKAIERALKNLNKHIGAEEVIQRKRYFGVSYQAMVWRLKNLGFITAGQKDSFLLVKPMSLEKSIFGETEESVVPAKMPERYVRIALDAYLMGKITVSRLAELLNKDVFELRTVLAESGLKRSLT